MLTAATQQRRHIAVSTPIGEDSLLLTRFRGREAISGLFRFELNMLGERANVAPAEIVGRNVTVRLNRTDDELRYFNGYVSEFYNAGPNERCTSYRAIVVPWLWFLTQTAECRIFQHRTTPQIVEQVFVDLGFSDFRIELREPYEPREYCVQYRETDFAFVSRLLEEEGIYYYFEHENGKHTLVLADALAGYHKLPEAEVRCDQTLDRTDLFNQVSAWHHRYEFRTGRVAHTDYNFATSRTSLLTAESSKWNLPNQRAFEKFDYPGCFQDKGRGDRLGRVRMQEIEAMQEAIDGSSTHRSFVPAGRFKVANHHAPAEIGREYVLIAVEHTATVQGSYLGANGDEQDEFYENRFTAIPAETLFRPARTTRKPVVEGPQTAIVVGPPGEEIWPDEFGRVKVQFHWDREGQQDDRSSCWIRPSQEHAGKRWGSIDLPRVGEEVIVAFLEGDPDRPIIKGRVYHGGNRPPFGLPAAKTRSGLKSNTHKGSGNNEISMDDTAGAEQLRTHAQYNMDSIVGNNQTLGVGVDRSAQIGNDDALCVGVNSKESIGVNKNVTVGTHHTEEVGEHVVIDAGTSITLQCGAATIHMNQAGVISISGSFVTTAALVNAAMLAPQTEISGEKANLQLGLVNVNLGGIMQIKGNEECQIAGGTLEIEAGGEAILMGTPLKLGEVAPPPPPPVIDPSLCPSGDGPSGPAAPKTNGSAGGETSAAEGAPSSGPTASPDTNAVGGGKPIPGMGDSDSADGDATADGSSPANGPERDAVGAATDAAEVLGNDLQKKGNAADADKASKVANAETELQGKASDAKASVNDAKQNLAGADQRLSDAQRDIAAKAQGASNGDYKDALRSANDLSAAEADQFNSNKALKQAELDAGKSLDAANKSVNDARNLPDGSNLKTAGKVLGTIGKGADLYTLGKGGYDAYGKWNSGDQHGAFVEGGKAIGDVAVGGAAAWAGGVAGLKASALCGPYAWACAPVFMVGGAFAGSYYATPYGQQGGAALGGAVADVAGYPEKPTPKTPKSNAPAQGSVPRGPTRNCFAVDTLVSTPFGLRPIQELLPSDAVHVRDESGTTVLGHVTRFQENHVDEVIEINFGVDRVVTTARHRWFIQGSGWRYAGDLLPGDVLITRDDTAQPIIAIERCKKRQRVFNLEVEPHHNFYVGESSVLVHNGLKN
jgi:type VI secretion system secreted protein VgrG